METTFAPDCVLHHERKKNWNILLAGDKFLDIYLANCYDFEC